MGMFGTKSCKISGSNGELELDKSNIDPTYFLPNELIHTSVLTGRKNYINLKEHSGFKIFVPLDQYADSGSKFDEIYNYNHQNVFFYPHKDGQPMKDIYEDMIPYSVIKIEPFYLSQDTFYDAVNIEIKSTKQHAFVTGSQLSLGYGFSYGTSWGLGF